MTTIIMESDTLKRVLLMLHRRYKQVCSEDEKEQKQTAKQIHAYTIAMQVISSIQDEIAHYLLTGENKENPILFDEEGYMIY